MHYVPSHDCQVTEAMKRRELLVFKEVVWMGYPHNCTSDGCNKLQLPKFCHKRKWLP